MGSLGFSRYRPLRGMNWTPVLGLRQGPGRFTGPAYWSSFNPTSRTWGVGLPAYHLNPINFINDRKSFYYKKKKPRNTKVSPLFYKNISVYLFFFSITYNFIRIISTYYIFMLLPKIFIRKINITNYVSN